MNLTSPSWRRHDTTAYGDRLRAERRQWQSPRFVAQQLVVALENPTLAGDPNAIISRAEAAREFARLHPTAVQRLGEAVVAGAVPSRSACRWCASTLWALVHRKPVPNPLDPGVRLLLGPPCSHGSRMTPAERRDLMAKLNARVAPSRTAVRRRQQAKVIEQQREIRASGGKGGFAVGDPKSWRRWAAEDLPARAPWATNVRLDNREGHYRTHSTACICEGCKGKVTTYTNNTTTGTWTR
jgi:hypothetical protein